MSDRFWSKVDRRGPDECWEWLAYRKEKGYGQYREGGKIRSAHRVSFEMEHGPVPDGMYLDHTCFNRACVNPRHLRPATPATNARNRKGADSDCASGLRGVRKKGSRWEATVKTNGKRIYLGMHASRRTPPTRQSWHGANCGRPSMADFLLFCAAVFSVAGILAYAADRENQTPANEDHETEDQI